MHCVGCILLVVSGCSIACSVRMLSYTLTHQMTECMRVDVLREYKCRKGSTMLWLLETTLGVAAKMNPVNAQQSFKSCTVTCHKCNAGLIRTA